MIFRPFAATGTPISVISFGAMRWPSEAACRDIVARGMDAGMNYVDASTGYVDGKSLGWTGRAVKERRAQIRFSCKTAFSGAPRADELRRTIERCLAEAGTDYFDFWQLWGLSNPETLAAAREKGGFFDGVRKARADGLIRTGLGFTFHGPPELFRAAVDTGEFVCATVSYNLLNRKEEDPIAYAGAHGVGVVIMNPLAGGVLGLAGDSKLDFLRGGGIGPSYGALRFLLANRNITTALVGFRTVQEVDQAMLALEGAEALDEAFRKDLAAKMDAVTLISGQFCTGCGYCKDCPHGANPAKLMQTMRDFTRYGVEESRLADWIWSKHAHDDPIRALRLCQECGECENKCPQHLQIVEAFRKAKAAMGIAVKP